MSHTSSPSLDAATAVPASRTRMAIRLTESTAPRPGGAAPAPAKAPAPAPPAPAEQPARPSRVVREAVETTQAAIRATEEAAQQLPGLLRKNRDKLRDSGRRLPRPLPREE